MCKSCIGEPRELMDTCETFILLSMSMGEDGYPLIAVCGIIDRDGIRGRGSNLLI